MTTSGASVRSAIALPSPVVEPPPIDTTLEYALEFINDDELVEVTPKSVRIRKKLLLEHERKKASRKKEAA